MIAGSCHRISARRRARGHEQRGARYGVIVQSDRLHLSTVLVAPTSAHARSAPHRVLIDVEDVQTQVLTEPIHAIDVDQLGPLVARLSPQAMSDIRAAMAWTLDL